MNDLKQYVSVFLLVAIVVFSLYMLRNTWILGANDDDDSSFAFSIDGVNMYLFSTSVLYWYTLSIAWDISTASFVTSEKL